jgi:YesN/AraC family two-component response regulator
LEECYQIVEASNGKEALEQIAKQQPHLVISDIMMPEMRGDEMCQILKGNMETSHIPVILLTALSDRESILHGLEIKADSYVVKPFDMDILKANIASVLANKEFLRQRFAGLNYRIEDLPKEVQESPGLSLDQEFLTKATNLIQKNLGKEFNVDDLCIEMGMSRSSLYNKIKALTDRSPSDFIRQIRMTEAAHLLKSKKHTVAEVSDMMGYSDPKYFTDIFKKHYGMTPSAYMKQSQEV